MSIFKRANIFSMTPSEVQQIVEKTGQEASYIAVNKTEAIQALRNGIVYSTKGIVTTHSGARVDRSVFKGAKDYARGDII